MSYEGARPDPWRDEDYWVEKKSDLVNAWSEAYSTDKAIAFCDRIVATRAVPDELAAVVNLVPNVRPERAHGAHTSLNTLIRSRLVREGRAA